MFGTKKQKTYLKMFYLYYNASCIKQQFANSIAFSVALQQVFYLDLTELLRSLYLIFQGFVYYYIYLSYYKTLSVVFVISHHFDTFLLFFKS